MADEEPLKLGKGVAFVKSRLKRLRKGDDTWEADFRALPRPLIQSETHYMGMVVTTSDGSLLAQRTTHGRPGVNDLATLLADAMRRPFTGRSHRPSLIRLRGHPQWRGLFPALKELDIEVSVGRKLQGIENAYREQLRLERERARAGMVKPSPKQSNVETTFPAVARYVRGCGYIEIGDQESFGFVVRAIGYGGVDFEDNKPDTLAEAMAALEVGLIHWFEDQGGETL